MNPLLPLAMCSAFVQHLERCGIVKVDWEKLDVCNCVWEESAGGTRTKVFECEKCKNKKL